MKAYPLHFLEKTPKGTKQGAKLPEVSKRGRETDVFLAFSRYPPRIKRIEQDLRRRTLYPGELRGQAGCIVLSFEGNVKNNILPGERTTYYPAIFRTEAFQSA